MMPALRTIRPASSRPTTCFSSPSWKASIWMQGLRRPVTSTTAASPMCSRVPTGRPSRSMPRVVMFSPSAPGATSKPASATSAKSSSWMRCTWRRFGWVGSCAIRERCLTVTPAWMSPSTPSPASRVMLSRFGLVNEYSPLLLTAVTVALMPSAPFRSAVIHQEPNRSVAPPPAPRGTPPTAGPGARRPPRTPRSSPAPPPTQRPRRPWRRPPSRRCRPR